MLYGAMLYYAMVCNTNALCRVMLCYAILCCAMEAHHMPCTALVCDAMVGCAVLVYLNMMCCAMPCNAGAGPDSPFSYDRSSWLTVCEGVYRDPTHMRSPLRLILQECLRSPETLVWIYPMRRALQDPPIGDVQLDFS